jgi:hypothetical protein
MPIQLNLLAEARALEDQRRRDPVKRLILAGVVVVVMLLVWSSSLLVKTIAAKGDVTRLDGELSSRTNQYRQILDNQSQLSEGKLKLAKLHQYATNRFLVGSLLNALQQVKIDNVQLVRLKLDQTYVLVAAKTNSDRTIAKPATATEKILLTLNAKDVNPSSGDAFKKYQDAVSGSPYFQEKLEKTGDFRLANLGQPQVDPEGKSFVLFTLEARLPDKTR